jgi:hypothetical protein
LLTDEYLIGETWPYGIRSHRRTLISNRLDLF